MNSWLTLAHTPNSIGTTELFALLQTGFSVVIQQDKAGLITLADIELDQKSCGLERNKITLDATLDQAHGVITYAFKQLKRKPKVFRDPEQPNIIYVIFGLDPE